MLYTHNNRVFFNHKKGILSFVTTQMNLESIMLGEIHQKGKINIVCYHIQCDVELLYVESKKKS